MQYSRSSTPSGLGHRASNFDLRSSFGNSRYSLEHQDRDAMLPQRQSDLPPPLPPLEPLQGPYRRVRKYSSSSSLRDSSTVAGTYPCLRPSEGYSDTRSMLSPFPDLGGVSGLPPLGSFPALPPLGSSSFLPPLSQSAVSSPFYPQSGRNSLGTGHHHQNSFGSYGRPFASRTPSSSDGQSEWDGISRLFSDTSVNTPSLSLGSATSLAGGRRIRRRGSSADLRHGQSSTLQGGTLPSSASLSSYGELGSSLSHAGSSLGMLPMLPMPPVPRIGSRSGTGHLVMTTDYRVMRISHNVLIWLGMSTSSVTSVGTSMSGLVGQPISYLVAASDQPQFSDYLAELHAERRKAEKYRLNAMSSSGDGSAKGVCTRVHLTVESLKTY